ncbi:AraC family transcriptional regulator [Streptococcus marmotae]|uniref:AraC family transcriptional regulator n=1 Tax=Streptococcus marmotae TaxID=1825069 RepID=UPI00083556A8|nr:helix-turn-helix domain-containing protein [Streptococcus marmotae]
MTSLDELLFQETKHEAKQKETGFIADYLDTELLKPNSTPRLSQHFFFQNKDVFMSKHSRYAPYPEHTHQFLELNYVYKGTCRQVINGTEQQLREGDLLLMDVNSRHSIESLGEKDILINLLFRNQDISLEWLGQLQGEQSLLYQFLLSDASANYQRDNFLIISTSNQPQLQATLHNMMTEYFLPQSFSQQIISQYLPILFYELARCLPRITEKELQLEETPYLKVLKIIDKEFATISLHELAERLNFNKNYLSNLIKAESGFPLTQLINQRKLMKARLLLQSTHLPIHEIALEVGFSNKTYFYKKYKETFGHGPKEEREK